MELGDKVIRLAEELQADIADEYVTTVAASFARPVATSVAGAAQRASINADPSSNVGQLAASHAPRRLAQAAYPFTSINGLIVWLKAHRDESSAPDLRRLRAAGAVLA